MNAETQYEDTVSTMVLENMKNKLINAFKANGESLTSAGSTGYSLRSIRKNYQANEELRRAKIDGAITWLRSELLEMRSQDQQLAKTLLGVSSEIQKMRRESRLSSAPQTTDYTS